MARLSNMVSRAAGPVAVYVCNGQISPQPEGFRLCPLGVQFYSPKRIAEFKLMDFELSAPGNRKEIIRCTGVVVHCKPLENRSAYRVWIKFLDLPDRHCDRIRQMAKAGRHICPFCENF